MKTKITISVVSLLLLASTIGCSGVEFAQGPNQSTEAIPGATYKETFNIKQDDKQGVVDVLFVVDNSGSMIEEQKKIGERLNRFTSVLDQADWQIGITTTDVSSGPYGLKGTLLDFQGTNTHILTPAVPNYKNAFLKTVVRSETGDCVSNCPSSDEQPLRASILAMQKHAAENLGFFRPDADLAIVILTDEDEMSDGPSTATRPEEVVSAAKSIFGPNKKITAYGIIVQPGDNGCYNQQYNTGGTFGTYASRLATLTGGLTGSICDSDYSRNLERIGERVKNLLSAIELAHIPDPSSLEISVTPEIPGLTWSVDGRKVRFSSPPPTGTKIHVKYKTPGGDNGNGNGHP